MKSNKPVRSSIGAVVLTAASFTLVSATPASAGLLKADPGRPSPFIEHPAALAKDPVHTPFNKIERNPSQKAWARVKNFDQIVILPVNIRYLRHKEHASPAEQMKEARAAANMAEYMRAKFQQAIAKGGKYRVVSRPGHKTLVLELALVELQPTIVPLNVVGTGASVVAPGANFVTSLASRGTIAFEGKLRNGETGELLEEFTDREHDKSSVFSFRDYASYAHGRRTADDWATELDAMSRTPRNQKVHGAMAFTLNPM